MQCLPHFGTIVQCLFVIAEPGQFVVIALRMRWSNAGIASCDIGSVEARQHRPAILAAVGSQTASVKLAEGFKDP
ncbi:MAG: hypothetical protein GX456_18995 [Verrucomicrobia bacterium]|nr:hypothetical protein [Verrucomicrobiota bacterium]